MGNRTFMPGSDVRVYRGQETRKIRGWRETKRTPSSVYDVSSRRKGPGMIILSEERKATRYARHRGPSNVLENKARFGTRSKNLTV